MIMKRTKILRDIIQKEAVRAEGLKAEVERLQDDLFAARQAVLTEGLEAERLRTVLGEIADLLYGDDSGINMAAHALAGEKE
jgi:hypothetical protein